MKKMKYSKNHTKKFQPAKVFSVNSPTDLINSVSLVFLGGHPQNIHDLCVRLKETMATREEINVYYFKILASLEDYSDEDVVFFHQKYSPELSPKCVRHLNARSHYLIDFVIENHQKDLLKIFKTSVESNCGEVLSRLLKIHHLTETERIKFLRRAILSGAPESFELLHQNTYHPSLVRMAASIKSPLLAKTLGKNTLPNYVFRKMLKKSKSLKKTNKKEARESLVFFWPFLDKKTKTQTSKIKLFSSCPMAQKERLRSVVGFNQKETARKM